jgi:hypothetical protein
MFENIKHELIYVKILLYIEKTMEYYINDNDIFIKNLNELKICEVSGWVKDIKKKFVNKTLLKPNWVLIVKLLICKMLNKKEVHL